MPKWDMSDVKAKGFFIDKDGKGRRIENVAQPKIKKADKRSKAKDHIEAVLKASGVKYTTEYKFHPTRKWRFDWYVPGIACAVEYEGIFSAKSRHTTVTGMSGDCDKYREAALMGIKVLRYTALNVNCFAADLNRALQQ